MCVCVCLLVSALMTSRDVIVRRHDVTAWRLDILWRLLSKNTDKEGTSREGASTLWRFHYMYHRAAKYPKRVKIGPWNFWKIITWTTLLVWIKVHDVICFINTCHIFFPYELHGDHGLTTAFYCTQNEEKWSAFLCFTTYQDFDFRSENWSP